QCRSKEGKHIEKGPIGLSVVDDALGVRKRHFGSPIAILLIHGSACLISDIRQRNSASPPIVSNHFSRWGQNGWFAPAGSDGHNAYFALSHERFPYKGPRISMTDVSGVVAVF